MVSEFPDENDDLNDTEMTADTEEDELVQSKAKKRKATTPVTRTTKSKVRVAGNSKTYLCYPRA